MKPGFQKWCICSSDQWWFRTSVGLEGEPHPSGRENMYCKSCRTWVRAYDVRGG